MHVFPLFIPPTPIFVAFAGLTAAPQPCRVLNSHELLAILRQFLVRSDDPQSVSLACMIRPPPPYGSFSPLRISCSMFHASVFTSFAFYHVCRRATPSSLRPQHMNKRLSGFVFTGSVLFHVSDHGLQHSFIDKVKPLHVFKSGAESGGVYQIKFTSSYPAPAPRLC